MFGKKKFFSPPPLLHFGPWPFFPHGPLALPPLSLLGQPSRAPRPLGPASRVGPAFASNCYRSLGPSPSATAARATTTDSPAPPASTFPHLPQPPRASQAARQQPPPRARSSRRGRISLRPASTKGCRTPCRSPCCSPRSNFMPARARGCRNRCSEVTGIRRPPLRVNRRRPCFSPLRASPFSPLSPRAVYFSFRSP